MQSPKISELVEKIRQATSRPDFTTLSTIEHDLLMQYIRDLYEELDALRFTNNTNLKQNPGGVQNPVDERNETATLTPKRTLFSNKGLLLNDIPGDKELPTAKKESTIITKKETPSVPSVGKTEKLRSSVISINESIQSSESLNEKLKSSATGEMHKKLASKPLKELIGLNQRFVILNELFKGNSEAFAAAVGHIDSLNDYAAADAFVKNQLVSNYFWDESSQSTRLFLKLVRQKFGVE